MAHIDEYISRHMHYIPYESPPIRLWPAGEDDKKRYYLSTLFILFKQLKKDLEKRL